MDKMKYGHLIGIFSLFCVILVLIFIAVSKHNLNEKEQLIETEKTAFCALGYQFITVNGQTVQVMERGVQSAQPMGCVGGSK